MILYEYPFNERIRTYLRLQQLFNRLGQLLARTEALDHHFALITLFEIMDVGARADLKSDLLKDLDKQRHTLDSYRGNPAIAEAVLDKVINELDLCFEALNNQPGKAGPVAQSLNFHPASQSRKPDRLPTPARPDPRLLLSFGPVFRVL